MVWIRAPALIPDIPRASKQKSWKSKATSKQLLRPPERKSAGTTEGKRKSKRQRQQGGTYEPAASVAGRHKRQKNVYQD
ncbi:hypothetical protein PC111_g6296 [Phytophthora cactorum]|nr:hypothetical protein PC111_g6296 [Phytophthora cactorum]